LKILLLLFPFFFGITFSQAETIFNLQDTISTRIKNDVSYLVQELDEVLVSPSKFLESSREISKKVVSINRNTVELANPKTSADLLETTGNIFIQKSQLGGGSPIIRGFSTNRLVISIDGVRLNNAIYRGGNIHNVISISPMTLQNIEVILGSESGLYGSEANGGLMNF
jgi:hemoglobin/transferrin/lactoferrin receptor protein